MSARRYYAEAISEARDLGAEREQGLAAGDGPRGDGPVGRDHRAPAGPGRGGAAGAGRRSTEEIAAAHELRGEEKEVS